ncbi:MAG: Phosphate-selective porin O and P [Candidatus Kentron sp. G]|nr:MAG: Phosphate-selective porin O and P [Candidatus Kentron sp. G]VFN06268.1 MAG: Phosphate-selective porin O and P [Candidatus Kentron sp. G]
MKTSLRIKAAILGMGAALVLTAGAVTAGEETNDEKGCSCENCEKDRGWKFNKFCDLFNIGKLYESDTGFIDKFAIIGRYQAQYHWSDGDDVGDSFDNWENHRRLRGGFKIGFLDDFEFVGQLNLNPEKGRFFKDVEDLLVTWKPSDSFYLFVGKQKAAVTREWGESSKTMKTLERSQLVNQIVPDKIGGVVAGYQFTDRIHAEAGVYSGSNTEEWSLPWSTEGDGAASVRVAYDLTDATEVRFDYFYADGAGRDNAVEDYDQIFSLNSESDWGRFHLVTDLMYGEGTGDVSDVYGAVLMPYYDIADKFDVVLRYTYSDSDDKDGIRLQKRYEQTVAEYGDSGDSYHAIYGGLNYYICKDKLKMMLGLEYSTLDRFQEDTDSTDDFDQVTFFSGIRLYF